MFEEKLPEARVAEDSLETAKNRICTRGLTLTYTSWLFYHYMHRASSKDGWCSHGCIGFIFIQDTSPSADFEEDMREHHVPERGSECNCEWDMYPKDTQASNYADDKMHIYSQMHKPDHYLRQNVNVRQCAVAQCEASLTNLALSHETDCRWSDSV